MCDLGHCSAVSTHFAVIARLNAPQERKRTELCPAHLTLALKLSYADLTMIVEYGGLGKSWAVHPGGNP